jgi:pyruvate dehydrogenase E1 component alpha subunit
VPEKLDLKLAFKVLQVRYWQHIVNEGLKKNLFKVPVHCAFGHEAIAVAVSAMMCPLDRLVLSHRNIAYNLARSGRLQPVYDEYKHLPSGASGGRLGSMNLANPDCGVIYTSSILGNNMPVACGIALAHLVLKREGIVTVLTGDGAMEEGTFYETLDMSKYQKLPLLLMIENNKFAMSSTIEERRVPIDVASMCKAFGTPYYFLTGNLVFDYVVQLKEIRKIITRNATPVVVEVDLSNLNRHAGATPGWPTDPVVIDLKRGLLVQESAYDPIHVLKQKLDPDVFAGLEGEVLSENWSV